MPIEMTCSCGCSFRLADEYAGQRSRCPSCKTILPVPELEPVLVVPLDEEETPLDQLEEITDEPSPRAALPVPRIKPPRYPLEAAAEPTPSRHAVSEGPAPGQTPERRPRYEEGPTRLSSAVYLKDLPDPTPMRRGRQTTSGGGLFDNMDGSIAGGLAAMALAVVWFLGGLMFGIIFFYPPIVFVIGLGTFLKGLSRNN